MYSYFAVLKSWHASICILSTKNLPLCMPQEGPVLQKVLDVFGAIFHFSPLSEGQCSAATQSQLCVSEPLNSQSLVTYL